MTEKALLVEYGDFECPYCSDAYPAIKEVRRRMGAELRFEFRHFPVTERHPHAELAAEAAEAARAQGRFTEMHDRLFEGGPKHLERDDLLAHARELGLDLERFTTELDSHVHLQRVREQAEEARSLGLAGTPAFFVGGELYEGFYDAETLTEALRDSVGG